MYNRKNALVADALNSEVVPVFLTLTESLFCGY